MTKFKLRSTLILCLSLLFAVFCAPTLTRAGAMPFYDLKPQEIVFRAEFSTDYRKSSAERKHNIALAAKSLDKTLIDVGGEFSFNRAVGERTKKRGYRIAKIIVNGEFTEGVGGGVCQVSTTLYNAALLAGLCVTESHPHSLSVGYVPLSFDAMVNSGSADLRFINRTHNPVIIRTFADGNTLTVKIYGEKMREKYRLKSVIKKEIKPEFITLIDKDGKYPDLYAGETRVLSYGKKGYESEGFLIKITDGKTASVRIRKDFYAAIKGVIAEGTAIRPTDPPDVSGVTDVMGVMNIARVASKKRSPENMATAFLR